MNRITRFVAVSAALTVLAASPLHAQDATRDVEVPRTRTLPGIDDPAFPYAQPEEVGLSSEKLARLGDEITEWVANGELVGAELLIVKNGRAAFHEAYGWADREVSDLVGLVAALGEREAVIVGHDWGAVVAAHASLLRPDVFPAAALLSVPYAPRSEGPLAPMEAAKAALPEGMTFYQLYFQEPGRAEAELEADVRSSLAMAFYSASGSAPPEHRWRPLFRAEDGIMSSVTMPETLPE